MNRRTRDSFYSLWSVAIILCFLLALFTVLFVSCQKAPDTGEELFPAAGEASGEPVIQDTQPEEPAMPEESEISAVLAQTSDYGQDYLNRFVFLGDVNTQVLAATGAVPETQVWSTESGSWNLADHADTYIRFIDSNNSTQEMTIYNAAAVRQPEYIVIHLGLTGLTHISEAEFKAAYTTLIDTIRMGSPYTKILCQSILPVVDSMAGDVSNARITKANEWILEVAEATDTRYLNAAELLMDDTGNLRSEYASSNGITLSEAGCQAVLLYIRTHGYM